MPINPTYPGVYVEELESSVRTIVGVRTSVTAFIGITPTGPRDKAVMIHSFEDYVHKFGGLSNDSNMSYAVYQYFMNGGQDAIIVAINDGALTASYSRNMKIDGSKTDPKDPSEFLKPDPKKIQFTARNPGISGKQISLLINVNKYDPNSFNLYVKERYGEISDKAAENKKNRENWERSSATLESFTNLSLSRNDSRFLNTVLEEDSNYIKRDPSDKLEESDIKIQHPGENQSALSRILGLYLSDMDEDLKGKPLDPIKGKAQIIPTDTDDQKNLDFINNKRGIYALDKADIFNVLCIPPYSKQADDHGQITTPQLDEDVDIAVYSYALDYCKRRRAILIIDPPRSWTTVSEPQDQKIGIDSTDLSTLRGKGKDAAIFFPRIKAPDRDGRSREFVPCGAIAGILARTDTERGVWKAPAGVDATIAGITDLSVKMTDQENGDLNPLGVNCLRIKPPYGIVVWGARTLRGADQLTDQWKYLPIRRLALYIEESLYRGTQWVVFEPNDEPLWAQIRLNVGAFMHDLFIKGAFQGSNPKEAYLVKCDHDTTTQTDIDRGIVNIVVGFQPLKPAEFVILQIKQLAGQSAGAASAGA
jgi:phage tail sheath protein FI